MNVETVNEINKEVNHAVSGLHTLILAYGFNISPMRDSAKNMLPMYSNQIADMLCMINQNLVSVQRILSEVNANERFNNN